jgi:hypothetical protein
MHCVGRGEQAHGSGCPPRTAAPVKGWFIRLHRDLTRRCRRHRWRASLGFSGRSPGPATVPSFAGASYGRGEVVAVRQDQALEREAELATLAHLFAAARMGDGGFLVVEGPAGIGKRYAGWWKATSARPRPTASAGPAMRPRAATRCWSPPCSPSWPPMALSRPRDRPAAVRHRAHRGDPPAPRLPEAADSHPPHSRRSCSIKLLVNRYDVGVTGFEPVTSSL